MIRAITKEQFVDTVAKRLGADPKKRTTFLMSGRPARLVLPLLSLLLLPAPARADLVDDLEKKIPPEVREIAHVAGTVASAYSGVSGAIDTATKLLQMVGILSASSDQVKAQFDALHQHLDTVAGTLSWQMSEQDREKHLADMIADVNGVAEAVRSHTTPDQDLNIDSRQWVTESEQPQAFKRYFIESATDGPWKAIIPDRPDHPDGLVYDWRLGVPALMQLISMRLHIIAAFDQNFTTDGNFHDDLITHRSALQEQMRKMVDGVRCNVQGTARWPYYSGLYMYDGAVSCADINTGANATESLRYQGGSRRPDSGVAGPQDVQDAAFQTWYQQNIPSRLDRLRRAVLLKMPLFEMQAMIDTLYLYANPGGFNLTGWNRIAVARSPGLCLDVQGGNAASGTPVWIWQCTGGAAQQWSYDRQAQKISETAFGKCLDVRNADSTPGTQVQIWDCLGNDAQRWTYDPEKRVITNALGNVLDIKGGNLAAQTLVWTWPRNEGPAQQWYQGIPNVRDVIIKGPPFPIRRTPFPFPSPER